MFIIENYRIEQLLHTKFPKNAIKKRMVAQLIKRSTVVISILAFPYQFPLFSFCSLNFKQYTTTLIN